MEIYTKIKKRIRRRMLMQAKFDTGEITGQKEPFVLYLGNGADKSCYKRIFQTRRIKGKELPHGLGGAMYMACQTLGNGSLYEPVLNGFSNSQAEFMGFWARRKENGRWLWYTQDMGWQPLSEDYAPKRLFFVGDNIRELFDDDTAFVALEAQWWDPAAQKPARNGYPMFSNALMAHAFGAFEGHTYCNTLAAYENAVKNGYRYFEADVSCTEDNRLVLCHGWKKKNAKCIGLAESDEREHLNYNQAMQLKAHGHKIMDMRQFYRKVKKRKNDVYEIDIHDTGRKALKRQIHALLDDFEYDAEALGRLLIQVMNEQMYETVDQIYPFQYYQYLVGGKIHQLDDILNFCLDHGICAVALRANFATPGIIQKIKYTGLYTMCYTVKEDAEFAKYLLGIGVDTICTDYVTKEALSMAQDTFGQKPFYLASLPQEGDLPKEESTFWCRNDGTDQVREIRFQADAAACRAFHFQLVIDGKTYWYAADGLYHGQNDFVRNANLRKYLFTAGQKLPDLVVKEGMTARMVAACEGDS